MAYEESPRILVVDDEPDMLKLITVRLRAENFAVEVARSGPEALEQLARAQFALMITDLMMPGMSGMELLERVQKNWPEMAVIILTAHGTIEGAVEAVKKGAIDFLTKPVRSGELMLRVNNALHQWELEQELKDLRDQIQRSKPVQDSIVGQSPAIRWVLQQISRLASLDVAVLIYGESGTGKELVARAIHRESSRRTQPFVIVNCGALSEELLRDELFGHEKGAFTGAHAQKKGLLETAEGGTLFLDEIGEISPAMQVQLLRFLQFQEFSRIGGNQTMQANVRIISATNRDLQRAVKEGTFREDLFYRIDVVPVRLPALRERREDIPLLIHHFVQRFQSELGTIQAKGFTPEAIREMTNQNWPGNIRELENKVKRLMVMSNREWIGIESMVTDPMSAAFQVLPEQLPYQSYKQKILESADRAYFENILRHHRGNISEAARAADMDRKSFWRKMKQYGVDGNSYRAGS